MKKLTLSLMAIFVVLALAACGQKAAETPASSAPAASATPAAAKEVTLKIGASSVPHAEILNSLERQIENTRR